MNLLRLCSATNQAHHGLKILTETVSKRTESSKDLGTVLPADAAHQVEILM
jgi:hypothetical protein